MLPTVTETFTCTDSASSSVEPAQQQCWEKGCCGWLGGWMDGWVPPETRDALLVRAESATVPCGWTREWSLDIISHPLYTSNFLLFLHFSFFEVLLPLCPMCPFHSLFLLCFCFQSNRQDFPICAQLIYTMKSSTFAKVSQYALH